MIIARENVDAEFLEKYAEKIALIIKKDFRFAGAVITDSEFMNLSDEWSQKTLVAFINQKLRISVHKRLSKKSEQTRSEKAPSDSKKNEPDRDESSKPTRSKIIEEYSPPPQPPSNLINRKRPKYYFNDESLFTSFRKNPKEFLETHKDVVYKALAFFLLFVVTSIDFHGLSASSNRPTVTKTEQQSQPIQPPKTLQTLDDSEKQTRKSLSGENSSDIAIKIEKVEKEKSADFMLAFQKYWSDLNNRDFSSAYNSITGSQKDLMGSLEDYRSGYSTMIENKLTDAKILEKTDHTARISYTLQAKDRIDGKIKVQVFRGVASLVNSNGVWKIDSMEADLINSFNE